MDAKTCGRCATQKPLTDFYAMKRAKDGRQAQCKDCQLSAQRDRYYGEGGRQAAKDAKLRRGYGITLEDFERMESEQGGKCKICGLTCSTGNRLAVDHCHETGKVRGLLCLNCNQALGKFFDNPSLLRSAAAYLEGS